MTLLTIIKITDTKYKVVGQYNYPYGDTTLNIAPLDQDFINKGILIDPSLIIPPVIPSGQQVSGMFINPQTKAITYEYAAIPKTQEDIISDLQNTVAELIKESLV